jgi:predicted restriction endonuclease
LDVWDDDLQIEDVVAPGTWAEPAALEARFALAVPEVRQSVSRRIERGPIGDEVKKARGFKCQICEALGQTPYCFRKPDDTWYVEAHHVRFVSSAQIGVLSACNIVAVCPNHHRQLHFGGVKWEDVGADFIFHLPDGPCCVPKLVL